MKYLLWAGKLGLTLFWIALLIAWQGQPAKPFAMLLGATAVGILLLNLLCVVLFAKNFQPARNVWLDRVQLLLFGAFHLRHLPLQAVEAKEEFLAAPRDQSEDQPCANQTDQEHAS